MSRLALDPELKQAALSGFPNCSDGVKPLTIITRCILPSLSVLSIFCTFLKFYLFLLLAALGLHCCTRAFSSCGERGLLFVAVRELLIVVASLVEHGL